MCYIEGLIISVNLIHMPTYKRSNDFNAANNYEKTPKLLKLKDQFQNGCVVVVNADQIKRKCTFTIKICRHCTRYFKHD